MELRASSESIPSRTGGAQVTTGAPPVRQEDSAKIVPN